MTNCYVLHSAAGACWIVDAGFDPESLLAFIKQHKLNLHQVVLTHAHVDHIAGLAVVRQAYPNVPILIHAAERQFPTDPVLNLSWALSRPIVAPEPTGTFAHGDTLTLDNITFEVRHTPGHSPGGVCLYQREEGVALVGDTLFNGSIGRTDFPTSNHDQLLKSIEQQLYTLPDQTRVLPGHMRPTTIGHERLTNPFIRRTD